MGRPEPEPCALGGCDELMAVGSDKRQRSRSVECRKQASNRRKREQRAAGRVGHIKSGRGN